MGSLLLLVEAQRLATPKLRLPLVLFKAFGRPLVIAYQYHVSCQHGMGYGTQPCLLRCSGRNTRNYHSTFSPRPPKPPTALRFLINFSSAICSSQRLAFDYVTWVRYYAQILTVLNR